jgi:outer membrane receptor protein involved in Fe transport
MDSRATRKTCRQTPTSFCMDHQDLTYMAISFYRAMLVVQENNPDLKWEVRKSFNIGLDFTILENRINGAIDVFHDETNDMLFLYPLPQPPFLTNKVYANAANAINKGLEVTLGAVIVENKNFRWENTRQYRYAGKQDYQLIRSIQGYRSY